MKIHTRWVVLYGSILMGSTNYRDLPILFNHLQQDMHLDVSHLGGLMGLQGVCHVMGVCFFGYCSSRVVSRMNLLGYCAVVWALGTSLTAGATGIWSLMLSRALVGLSSGVVGPISQCLVAEWVAPVARGRAFSVAVAMDFTGQTLSAAGLAFFINQVGSWRLPLLAMVFVTLAFAAFAFMSVHAEPTREASDLAHTSWVTQIKRVFRTPSMRVIILQGFLASTQKEVNALICLWFQQCGFSATIAADLYSVMILGNLVGSLCSGYFADILAAYSPDFGRLLFGQLGDLWRLPTLCLLLRTGPGGQLIPTLICALLYGSTQSLCYVGAVKPLCTEAVPPALVGTAIAIAATVDGAFAAAAGGPVVGWSAQFLYGYRQGDIDPSNRIALQSALGTVLIVSWLGTICCFTFLYWTFPADRRRACLAVQESLLPLLVEEGAVHGSRDHRKLPMLSHFKVAPAAVEPIVTPPTKHDFLYDQLTPEAKIRQTVSVLDLSVPLLLAPGVIDDLTVPLLLASGETTKSRLRGRRLRAHASDPTTGGPWDACPPPLQPLGLRRQQHV